MEIEVVAHEVVKADTLKIEKAEIGAHEAVKADTLGAEKAEIVAIVVLEEVLGAGTGQINTPEIGMMVIGAVVLGAKVETGAQEAVKADILETEKAEAGVQEAVKATMSAVGTAEVRDTLGLEAAVQGAKVDTLETEKAERGAAAEAVKVDLTAARRAGKEAMEANAEETAPLTGRDPRNIPAGIAMMTLQEAQTNLDPVLTAQNS